MNVRNQDYAGYADHDGGIIPPHGVEVSNPLGILDVMTQYRVSGASAYIFEVAVRRDAYRTARGRNEASGDTLNVVYTNPTTDPVSSVSDTLGYTPLDTYDRDGIHFLSFRKTINSSAPLPLVALGGRDIHVDALVGTTSLWTNKGVKTLTPMISPQALLNKQIAFNQQLEIASLVTRITALESN